MFTIEQSTFLHALGYAIGHSLWQMSLLWLVYMAIVHVNQWTSSQRYNLAVSVAGTGFAWFIATLVYYSTHINLGDDTQTLPVAFGSEKNFTPSGKFIFIYHSVMATLRSLAPYFSCAYLVVMLVLSIRLINGFNQVKQLRTQGLSKASVDWRLFVKKHAELLGIKRSVLLHISNIASSPLTIGFWKPVILIPVASIAQLTTQQLEAVILHELAHIRRNDYLVNILLQLAEITLFFNPFMRLLLKQARLERENCCDDYVLQFQYNAAEYAKALLTIEKHSEENLLALGTNNQNECQLLNRIRRMVTPERRSFNYRQQLGLLFLITILGLGFTVITPRQQREATTMAVVEDNTIKNEEIVVKKVESKPGINTIVPQAVDLVKKLENYKEVRDFVESKEFKAASEKLAADAEKAANKINEQIQPHVAQIEKNALEIAQLAQQQPLQFVLNGIDVNNLQVNGKQLGEELAKVDWSKVSAPLLDNVEDIMALIPGAAGKDKWNMKINEAAIAAQKEQQRLVVEQGRVQMKKMERLQQKLNMEQDKMLRMINMEQMIKDSIRIAFAQPNIIAAPSLQDGLARAKKAAAIAPFRVPEEERTIPSTAPVTHFQFNYSLGNNQDNSNLDEDTDDDNDDNIAYKAAGRTFKRNEKCPDGRRQKTVTVFSGQVFANKVKEAWADAQQQANQDQWTSNVKQQVTHEIERELKELDRVEIKARITTKSSENGKVIMIELEGLQ